MRGDQPHSHKVTVDLKQQIIIVLLFSMKEVRKQCSSASSPLCNSRTARSIMLNHRVCAPIGRVGVRGSAALFNQWEYTTWLAIRVRAGQLRLTGPSCSMVWPESHHLVDRRRLPITCLR